MLLKEKVAEAKKAAAEMAKARRAPESGVNAIENKAWIDVLAGATSPASAAPSVSPPPIPHTAPQGDPTREIGTPSPLVRQGFVSGNTEPYPLPEPAIQTCRHAAK